MLQNSTVYHKEQSDLRLGQKYFCLNIYDTDISVSSLFNLQLIMKPWNLLQK